MNRIIRHDINCGSSWAGYRSSRPKEVSMTQFFKGCIAWIFIKEQRVVFIVGGGVRHSCVCISVTGNTCRMKSSVTDRNLHSLISDSQIYWEAAVDHQKSKCWSFPVFYDSRSVLHIVRRNQSELFDGVVDGSEIWVTGDQELLGSPVMFLPQLVAVVPWSLTPASPFGFWVQCFLFVYHFDRISLWLWVLFPTAAF